MLSVLRLPAAESQESPSYLIGPGDELRITVWAEPELSTSTTVRPDGRITVPLVEDLPAAGRTPADLADAIKSRLSQYRQDPLVTVMVVSGLGDLGQQIRVVGEAAAPTTLPYRSGMTLLDAMIAAGGLDRKADGNGAVIVRNEDNVATEIPVRISDLVRNGDGSANVALHPGDVIVIPEGFFEGEWRVTYNAIASETFSDNIDQDPDGSRDAGLVTRAGPGISISGQSARVVGALNADLVGVYQAGGEDEGFTLDPAISGTSTTELAPDTVFFDLSASVQRRLLDPRDTTSASGASTGNRDLVAALTASPYLVHRLGDFANVEWRYRFSPVLVDSSGEGDSLNHDASVLISSGEDFSRLGWSLTNRAGLEDRSDESNIETASTDLGLRYSLWQGFALTASVGYEHRIGDEDEDDNFDGVTWRGGFQYEPHSDLSLQASYGHTNDDDNLNASLRYEVGPRTSLTASYEEALESGQGRAASDLERAIIDPDTGEPVIRNDDPFTFDDETTRTKTARMAVSHQDGLNRFSFSGLRGTSDGGSEGDEKFYEAAVNWSRSLSEELSLSARASYEHSKFDEDNRTDDTYIGTLSLDYQFSESARTFASYSFQTRDSTDEDESFTENSVTIGISASW
jgi:polysaccharide export outer membrane protein